MHLPKELFDKLKEDIKKTTINNELIEKCKEIMERLIRERNGK